MEAASRLRMSGALLKGDGEQRGGGGQVGRW